MPHKTLEDLIREKLPDGDHGLLTPHSNDEYGILFTTSEDEIFDVIKSFLTKCNGCRYTKNDIEEDSEHFLYFAGNVPVMICAHVDTVNFSYPKKVYLTEKTSMIVAGPGESVSGDDRAGVLGIYMIAMHGVKPHLLFTKGEESGMIGAEKAAKSLVDLDIPDKINFIIALDRVGKDQAAYYNNGNEAFKKWVKTFGFKEVKGTGNDIRVLCPAWGISGVNLSIGYEKPHTKNDYIDFRVTRSCVNRVVQMIKEHPAAKFPFILDKNYNPPRKWYDYDNRICPVSTTLQPRWYLTESYFKETDDEMIDYRFSDYDKYEYDRATSYRDEYETEKPGNTEYLDFLPQLEGHVYPVPPFGPQISERELYDIYGAMAEITLHFGSKMTINFITLEWTWKKSKSGNWNDLDIHTLDVLNLFDRMNNNDIIDVETAIFLLEDYQSTWYTKYVDCFVKEKERKDERSLTE